MIDDELLAKFDRIEELPISEEMLGAYAEVNLTDLEKLKISTIADSSSEISSLLCDLEDLNIEFLANDFHEFNQFKFRVVAHQDLPDIDGCQLLQNYDAPSLNVEVMDNKIDNNFLGSYINTDNSSVENGNFFPTGDSFEQEDYSLDTNSATYNNADFGSESSDINDLDF